MLNERSRAEKVLAKLQSDERISLPALAASMGVPYPRLQSYLYGRAPFPAERAPALYMAVAEVDPSLALWAFSEIVGLPEIRHEARPLPAGADRDPILVDTLQAAAALGELQGDLANAGADVDALEAANLLPDARRARTELGQVVAKLEAVAARTNQGSLPLGRP